MELFQILFKSISNGHEIWTSQDKWRRQDNSHVQY